MTFRTLKPFNYEKLSPGELVIKPVEVGIKALNKANFREREISVTFKVWWHLGLRKKQIKCKRRHLNVVQL